MLELFIDLIVRAAGAAWCLIQWPARLALRAIHGNVRTIPRLRKWAIDNRWPY